MQAYGSPNADHPDMCVQVDQHSPAHNHVERWLRARLHQGPLSHQVIELTATGQHDMAATGRSGWPSSYPHDREYLTIRISALPQYYRTLVDVFDRRLTADLHGVSLGQARMPAPARCGAGRRHWLLDQVPGG